MILYCTNTSKLEYTDEKEIDMIFSTKSYYSSNISDIVLREKEYEQENMLC